VKETLHKEAMRIELDILTVIGFDFEFEFPFTFIEKHLAGKPMEDISQTLKVCLSTIYLKSPQRGYFLFYPPYLLAAAILYK
jgi:hypothetical protein